MSRNNINTDPTTGATEFIQLTDTPDTHTPANAYVVTNPSGNAIIYSTLPPTGATEFIQLTDTPGSITANQYVVGNGAGNALIFTASGPPTSFIQLTDTPASYTGANKLLAINSTNNGVQFATETLATIPHNFVQLNDTPNTLTPNNMIVVNGSGTALINQAQPSIPNHVFTGSYVDVPNGYGANGQVLSTNGSSTATWETPVTTFDQLTDVSDVISNNPNKVVTVNGAGTALIYTDKSDVSEFIQLSDVPNSYVGASSKFVKVKTDETGLEFVEGGAGSESLISLTDNTGGTYGVDNTNQCVAINPTADGFQYTNMAYLQGGYARLTHGMIKGYANYPSPHSGGFIYNDSDDEGGFFYFGTNRTNYNEARFLNDYWTTEIKTGGSCFYPVTGSDASLDIRPKYVGVGANAHSCGVELRVPNAINITAPFANNWYFDVLVNISWRIDLANMSNDIFCMWVCSREDMDDLILLNNDFDQVRKSDYFWINENGNVGGGQAYPNSISEGHITKTVTVQCGSGSTFPDLNVFMSCRRRDNYTPKGSFTVRSYYYINCSYTVLSMRAPASGVDRPSLSQEVPGIFWT